MTTGWRNREPVPPPTPRAVVEPVASANVAGLGHRSSARRAAVSILEAVEEEEPQSSNTIEMLDLGALRAVVVPSLSRALSGDGDAGTPREETTVAAAAAEDGAKHHREQLSPKDSPTSLIYRL